MMKKANLIETDKGLIPRGAGWYVVNAAQAEWKESDRHGKYCTFEGDPGFSQYGVNIHVLDPGQASCMYHRENQQEDFLVLLGECLLLVEEEEIYMKQWDFFHSPPGTNHVFVGAGDGPSAILMMGGRVGEGEVNYPVSSLAQRHGAGVREATDSPEIAYAGVTGRIIRSPWPL